MSNTNVEVKRGASENTATLVRRFQKKVQEAGILPRVRGIRYNERKQSTLKIKRSKLKRLKKGLEYEKLKRMGKVIEKKRRGGRR